MKFLKNIALIAALGLFAALPAKAQFDMFYAPRTVALVYPQAVNAGASSNFVADIRGYEGIAKLDIVTLTNGACSAASLTLYTSPDRTNWTALANYATATSNSVIYTNLYYGNGTPLATNIIMYPGTKTTPNAALAGFSTPYLAPAPMTNSGALTLSTGLQSIGFIIPDNARYLQAAYSFTGASTNTISIVLTARKQQD